MSLFTEWTELLNGQTENTFRSFWKEYSDGEMAIYTDLLSHKDEKFTGVVKDLAAKYGCSQQIFVGFLDGIKSSLKNADELDLDSVTEDTEVSLDVDFELLYYNMWKQEAQHLYSLEAWDNVFTPEKRKEIEKSYKRSKIYHAPVKIGRNDPCPCGSGKKYKNCCGKNA